MKIPNWLLSSTGEGVARRWKSIFSAVVPVAVIVAPLFGVELPELAELDKGVTNLIASLWALGSAIGAVSGWVRQVKYKQEKLGKYSVPSA